MSPRRRNKGRQEWPKHLKAHDRNGKRYYYWVDPRTKKEQSLKCPDNFKLAVKRTNALNNHIEKIKEDDLVNQIIKQHAIKKPKSITIAQCLEIYIEHCIALKQATNTIKVKKSRANNINKMIGHIEISKVTVEQASDVIDAQIIDKSTSNAVNIRSMMIDMYALAKAKGKLPRDFSDPASVTLKPVYRSTKARLTFDQFMIINDLAKNDYKRPWVYRCQLMAVLSGQRLSDVSRMRFKRDKDYDKVWLKWMDSDRKGTVPYSFIEDDYLFVVQQKTKALIKLNLDIRLDKIGYSIRDVVKMCRGDRTFSKHLFHHQRTRSGCTRGGRVSQNTMSRSFAHFRDLSGLTWGKQKKPTFHEMRSVSADLHEEQGRIAKHILGHKNQATTDIYLDPKGTKWKAIEN